MSFRGFTWSARPHPVTLTPPFGSSPSAFLPAFVLVIFPKQNPRCGQNRIAHAITMELRWPQGHSRTGSSSSAHAPQSGRSRGQHCIFGLTIWAELQKGLVCHPPFSLPAHLTASSNKPEWGAEACALRQGHCSFIFLISFLPLFLLVFSLQAPILLLSRIPPNQMQK